MDRLETFRREPLSHTCSIFCSALIAAVRGLSRARYKTLLPLDLLPAKKMAPSQHIRDRILKSFEILDDHRPINNEKVTYMAVAHRAMLNFAFGLLLFAFVAACSALTSKPSEDLIGRLGKDRELREMLRGPQGVPGPAGPKGDPGPAGPADRPVYKTQPK